MVPLQRNGTIFRFIRFMDHLRAGENDDTVLVRSVAFRSASEICRVQVGELWQKNGEHVPRHWFQKELLCLASGGINKAVVVYL